MLAEEGTDGNLESRWRSPQKYDNTGNETESKEEKNLNHIASRSGGGWGGYVILR